jgi:uncharacterized protein (TIGR00369 family)
MDAIDFIQGLLERKPLPLSKALGMELRELSPGKATFELDAGGLHHNPMGTVHGGVLSTLADSAMGMALGTTLADGDSFTTLELKINFLRPVVRGPLTARGSVANRGKSVAMTICDVSDGAGRLIAHATATNMILSGAQAEGRRPGDFITAAG